MNYSGLDRSLYPRLTAYIEALPNGLDSHPSVRTRADYNLILRKKIDGFLTQAKLPEHVRGRLLTQWRPGEWIPETIYAALSAFCRDAVWKTDQEFHAGMLDTASQMYATPFFRTLMFILSPSLMAMGAAKRWHSFHEGSDLAVIKQGATSVNLLLTFPDTLLPEACLRSIGATFCAAVSGAGARKPSCTLASIEPGRVNFFVAWDP
jgi:hypothetical protein